MATLCKTYSTEVAARQAVETLRAARVRGQDIRLLTGSQRHDVRREPAGAFAGAVRPDTPSGPTRAACTCAVSALAASPAMPNGSARAPLPMATAI
jgi:hypothetical protein